MERAKLIERIRALWRKGDAKRNKYAPERRIARKRAKQLMRRHRIDLSEVLDTPEDAPWRFAQREALFNRRRLREWEFALSEAIALWCDVRGAHAVLPGQPPRQAIAYLGEQLAVDRAVHLLRYCAGAALKGAREELRLKRCETRFGYVVHGVTIDGIYCAGASVLGGEGLRRRPRQHARERCFDYCMGFAHGMLKRAHDRLKQKYRQPDPTPSGRTSPRRKPGAAAAHGPEGPFPLALRKDRPWLEREIERRFGGVKPANDEPGVPGPKMVEPDHEIDIPTAQAGIAAAAAVDLETDRRIPEGVRR